MPSVFERIVGALIPQLSELRTDVDALKAQMETVMANQTEFDARMKQMDDATTEIANDLQTLRDEIAAGGSISDANLAVLDAKIATLKVLGADPSNPVPA